MEKLADATDTDTLRELLLFWKEYQRGVVYEDQLSVRLFGQRPADKDHTQWTRQRIRQAEDHLLEAGLLERTGESDGEGQVQVRLTPKGEAIK